MSLISFPRKVSSKVEELGPRTSTILVEETLTIQGVTVLAEEAERNGKSRFSIYLEAIPDSDPSNRQRRTVTSALPISGITLGVEEKEIPVLTRLVGREFGIFLEKSEISVHQESMVQQIITLQTENEKLREKNRALSANLHHLVEATREVS